LEDARARAIPGMSVPDKRKPPTACGRPGVYFQGPVVWCEECYGRLRSGEVPRVCEPWDSDPALPNERYKEVFRAAEVLRLAGVTSENEIIPTLAFAARSFELTNLGVMRERFARAGEDSAERKDLEGTFRRAFDALEVVRVVEGVPIIFWRPFKLVGYPYEETGVLEKVVIEVYLRSARGQDIAERYDRLMSRYGVPYEGGEGNLGWQASTGCLRIVVQPRAPGALSPLLEGRNIVHPERSQAPFPHPHIVGDTCEALIGSVSKKKGNTGFAFALGGRDRGRPVDPNYLIPAVVAWYVGGRGNVVTQHHLKPEVAEVLKNNLSHSTLRPGGKDLFHEKGWDSGEYIWEAIKRASQPILRVDNEIRGGYFGPLGYLFKE
jgi:hypothetical protein